MQSRLQQYMIDVVDKRTRSRMMAGIKGKNTAPEILVRRLLHRAGFRFRLHVRELPGQPDLVLRRYRAVVFVHGCFWHGHSCHFFKWPSTHGAFWREKIRANRERDERNERALAASGWRVMVIWECALKGSRRLDHETLARCMADWLRSDSEVLNIKA